MKVSADPNTLAALTAAAAVSSFEGPMGRGGCGPASGRLPDFPPDFLEGPAVCCLTPFADIPLEVVVVWLILVANTSKLEVFRRKIAASPNAKSFGKGQNSKQTKPSHPPCWLSVARAARFVCYSVSEFTGL